MGRVRAPFVALAVIACGEVDPAASPDALPSTPDVMAAPAPDADAGEANLADADLADAGRADAGARPPTEAEIAQDGGRFELRVDGRPFVVKGAVGREHLELLAERGGNTVRISHHQAGTLLDAAANAGLLAVVDLPVTDPEEDPGLYQDLARRWQEVQRVRQVIMAYRDHPALLMWGVGQVPASVTVDPWVHINAVATAARDADPAHPTLVTVSGALDRTRALSIRASAPEVSVLGLSITEPTSAAGLADRLSAIGWTRTTSVGPARPFVISALGPPLGPQIPRNAWGAAVEAPGAVKRDLYRAGVTACADAPDHCLGIIAHHWGSAAGPTPTWSALINDWGPSGVAPQAVEETAASQALTSAWSGTPPTNQAPVATQIAIAGRGFDDDAPVLPTGSVHTATLSVTDPDGDPLTFTWVLVPHSDNATVAPISGAISADEAHGRLSADLPAGRYRLFAFARDAGRVTHATLLFELTPRTQRLPAVEDAFGRNGQYADDNYGAETTMLSKLSNTAGFRREAFIKLDISTVTADLERAELKLYCRSAAPSRVRLVSADTAWDEGTVTWSRRPGTINLLETVTPRSRTTVTFDVTGHVRDRVRAGATSVAFGIQNLDVTKPVTSWHTKENAQDPPALVITYR